MWDTGVFTDVLRTGRGLNFDGSCFFLLWEQSGCLKASDLGEDLDSIQAGVGQRFRIGNAVAMSAIFWLQDATSICSGPELMQVFAITVKLVALGPYPRFWSGGGADLHTEQFVGMSALFSFAIGALSIAASLGNSALRSGSG